MVIISDEFLSSLFESSLASPTHKTNLSLPCRNVSKIKPLKKFCKFELIDLRNNSIGNTINLRSQTNLTYLYLQNNDIKKLDGFNHLRCLESLFLDQNRIEVIEHLDHCPLKKLSLYGQRLGQGQSLAFDPTCLKYLGYYLQHLNIASNNIVSLRPLHYLISLEFLDASDNKMTEVKQITDGFGHSLNLRSLNVLGNPVMKKKIAPKRIIAALPSLESLNRIAVSPQMHEACRHMEKVHDAGDWLENATNLNLKSILKRGTESLPTSLLPDVSDPMLDGPVNVIQERKYIHDSILIQ